MFRFSNVVITKISLLNCGLVRASKDKGDVFQMRLFSRKGKAVKKWHDRAMTIDPKKTKLILVGNGDAKDVPTWVYKRFTTSLDQS